jgi:lysophospholipase L1-like esterase
MNCGWGRALAPAILMLMCAPAGAEQRALSNKDAFALYGRAVQLMEAAAVSVPELARAGAPLTDNARGSLATLRSLGRQHAGVTWSFLSNLRAYLALADAIPRPDAFPAEAARQFAELRDLFHQGESNFRALLESKEAELRSPDPDDLAHYAEANARLGPPVAGRPRVVFLGASIVEGWRLNEYFSDRDFVNRGISGQTTGELLGRFPSDVVNLKPEAVLVAVTSNDIARGVAPATIESNLAAIADLAEFHKIKPLFGSIPPVSDYHRDQDPAFEVTRTRPPEQIRALNEWLQRFCRERNFAYVDYYSVLADAQGRLKAELGDDGLHPNSGGYREMAPVALKAIDQALGAEPKPRRRLRLFGPKR